MFEPKEILVSKAPSRASRKLHIGDTIFSLVRPYLMNIAYIDEVLADCIASTGFYVCTPCDMINGRYIYHLMRSPYVVNGLNTFMKGDNSPSIRKNDIENFLYPIPPIAEQQRIVEQIESLFSKLDEVKSKVDEVLEKIELRKGVILYQAFSGQLTKKWRNKNSIELSSWEQKVFKDVLDVRDGTHDSPQYYEEGYPLITSKNLKNGIITDKDVKYISEEDYKKINLRSKVDIGDVLFAMIGTIGNPVVVIEEPNYAIKNMALLKNIGKINPFFLKYYLESKVVKDKMQKDAKGSTQKFVSLGYLREFSIKVPSIDEQNEIVRILDSMLKKEYELEVILLNVLEQVKVMKKTILVKAFRGELGTNNPDEENAIELLKQIIKEQK